MNNPISEFLYDNLPQIYRYLDKDKDELQRFLKIFGGALDLIYRDIDILPYLRDFDKCPDEYLPYLCEMLGVVYEPSIPHEYQRRFLKNHVFLKRKKGTEIAIKYLVRELTGYDSFIKGDKVFIKIDIDLPEKSLEVTIGAVNNYIKYFVPVFFEIYLHILFIAGNRFPKTKHNIDFLTRMKWGINPWAINIDKDTKYFDGEYLFDGNIKFLGRDIYRKGVYHKVDVKTKMEFIHLVRDKEIITNAQFNGFRKFDGFINFDQEVNKVLDLIKSKARISEVIEGRTKPKMITSHKGKLKTFTGSKFDSRLTFGEMEVTFDGGYKLTNTIPL